MAVTYYIYNIVVLIIRNAQHISLYFTRLKKRVKTLSQKHKSLENAYIYIFIYFNLYLECVWCQCKNVYIYIDILDVFHPCMTMAIPITVYGSSMQPVQGYGMKWFYTYCEKKEREKKTMFVFYDVAIYIYTTPPFHTRYY